MSTRARARPGGHYRRGAEELAALAVADRLDGALCRGHAPDWDGEDDSDHAAWLCLHACPALQACAAVV